MNETLAPKSLDPRLHAYRPDLADARLEGRVQAARFVAGVPARIMSPTAPVHREASADSLQLTEALLGETLSVYETSPEGWSWVQLDADDYVGWIPSQALDHSVAGSTHKVSAVRTLAFAAPDIKSRLLTTLPFGARVAATGEAEDRNARYRAIAPAGYIVAQHLTALDTAESDWTTVAERFLGTPYLWGGKTDLGIDCSGLVQVALTACGIAAPRDTDMQEEALGAALQLNAGLPPLKRGDLVFWKGHVGLMCDAGTLLHANAHTMTVVAEPLAVCAERLAGKGLPVTSIRRIVAR